MSNGYPEYAAPASVTPSAALENGHGSIGMAPQAQSTNGLLDIVCGPLINYRRMTRDVTWHGSVLLVTSSTSPQPEIHLECLGPLAQTTSESAPRVTSPASQKLYQDPKSTFWRFLIDIPIQTYEAKWKYTLTAGAGAQTSKTVVIPSKTQSMRIMFHSCNGFSVGTDVDAWSGPALWNDVLRMHEQQPFHVMIGGGDQIYNDGVRVDGPLKEWTEIANPKKRRDYPFGEEIRAKSDEYYFNNYVRWYGQEPFKSANAIIPQLNIWVSFGAAIRTC